MLSKGSSYKLVHVWIRFDTFLFFGKIIPVLHCQNALILLRRVQHDGVYQLAKNLYVLFFQQGEVAFHELD